MKKFPRFIIIIKYLIAALLLWGVFSCLDGAELYKNIRSIPVSLLISALLAFNLAQFLCAERMRYYYARAGRQISWWFNLMLYYVGMFFNIFIPGGFGGDAYKIHILKKKGEFPVREGIRLQLSIRASGLYSLLLFMALSVFFMPVSADINQNLVISGVSGFVLLVSVGYFFSVRWILKESFATAFSVLRFSLPIQGLSLLCAALLTIGLGQGYYLPEYLFLFIIAAILGMFPVTIGGLGIREMVFLYGANYLSWFTGTNVSAEMGVALSLCNLAVTLGSSLLGLLFWERVKQYKF